MRHSTPDHSLPTSPPPRRTRRAVLVAGAVVLAFTAAGCSSGSSPEAADGKVTLTVITQSDFGYRPLYKAYEQAHPEITIKEVLLNGGDLNQKLAVQLSTGKGAPDIVGFSEESLAKFKSSHTKFLNLADYGVDNVKDPWIQWAYDTGTVDDGKYVMGVRTDIGGMGICYRIDLFAKAGLPTDSKAVGALWPTWADFISVGEKFKAKSTGAAFTANAGDPWVGMTLQLPTTFFAKADDAFYADQNPALKKNFFNAAQLSTSGLSGGFLPFSTDMAAAAKTGRFATAVCPAWMLSRIKERSGPANAGKWSVATAPEGGNWGGSYLSVPKQTAHPKEAAALATWLTSSAVQKQNFTSAGYLSSHPAVYHDPAVVAKTDPYFSNAPVGAIYAEAVDKLQPYYRSPHDADVAAAFINGITRVEQHKQTPEAAWEQSIKDAKAAVGP